MVLKINTYQIVIHIILNCSVCLVLSAHTSGPLSDPPVPAGFSHGGETRAPRGPVQQAGQGGPFGRCRRCGHHGQQVSVRSAFCDALCILLRCLEYAKILVPYSI